MSRDSIEDHNDPDLSPDDYETELYRDLHRLSRKRMEVHAHRALEEYMPLVAAFGSLVITAMLLFKGLQHIGLVGSTFDKFLIMMMVAAAVWMATSVAAKAMHRAPLNE